MRARLLPFLAVLTVLAGLGASASAAGAAGLHWAKPVRLEPASAGGLTAVSCPYSFFCAAVDASGNVVISTNPGAGRWSAPFRIEPASDGGLTGISCPTTRLCVAVDQSGNVITSTNPARGARYWSRPVRVDSAQSNGGGLAGLAGISCPSTRLCVAVDNAPSGNVVASTNPTGGSRAWGSTKIGGLLDAISCTYGTSFCVAAGTQHYWSAAPAAGASAWHATGAPASGGVISAIACPATNMCLGVGFANATTGFATSTSTPHSGSGTWSTVGVANAPPSSPQGVFDAVGCTSRRFCVAVDGTDNAYGTTSPTSGTWNGGLPIRPGSASVTSAVSCNPKECVVVDGAGVGTTGILR